MKCLKLGSKAIQIEINPFLQHGALRPLTAWCRSFSDSLNKLADVTSFFLFDHHRHSGESTVEKMVNVKSLNILTTLTFKAPVKR